ncbi:MAG: hypothetical protein E6940_02765 [Clostridium septicum]|uniref:O-antigen ligase family protein n=1 Tax=Clostridium septicum TaxID=1504 RepID=UPI0025827B86|nr:O-antigen ligase family protein [Clostridium septicum]MDU1312967.1 hypothetical protein [Clostridium septicum]
MCINIVTLVISIVTGIGTGLYGFEKRYHSANLTHGETGVLMGIFSIYLLCYKKEKYTNLYAMIIIVMVFATGSRKDLLYIIIVYSLYLIINMKKILTRKIKITSNQLMIYYCVFLIGVLFILLFGKSIATKLDLERMFSAITGIFGDGTSFIASDFSGKGRIDSIESWISLIKQNIFGVSFSFFDVQYNMQLNNYPTFPHSTMLFYYTVLGPLILVPLYLYIKTFINLIRIKSDYIYIFIYMFIYNFISGGALLNFKSIVINIFILWVGLKIIKERESRNYEGYNFSRRVWH